MYLPGFPPIYIDRCLGNCVSWIALSCNSLLSSFLRGVFSATPPVLVTGPSWYIPWFISMDGSSSLVILSSRVSLDEMTDFIGENTYHFCYITAIIASLRVLNVIKYSPSPELLSRNWLTPYHGGSLFFSALTRVSFSVLLIVSP